MPPDHSNSESDDPVSLKLVDDAPEVDPGQTDPEPASSDDRSDRRGLPVWLFVLAVIVFALVIGRQAQMASQLETRVEGLEAELVQSEALLEAHRAHLGQIRGGVQELSVQLDRLQILVDEDPLATDGFVDPDFDVDSFDPEL